MPINKTICSTTKQYAQPQNNTPNNTTKQYTQPYDSCCCVNPTTHIHIETPANTSNHTNTNKYQHNQITNTSKNTPHTTLNKKKVLNTI